MKRDHKKLALLLLLICVGTGSYYAANRAPQQHREMYLMQGGLGPAADVAPLTVRTMDKRKLVALRTRTSIGRTGETMTATVRTPDSYKTARIDLGIDVSSAYVLPVARISVAVYRGLTIGAFGSYAKNIMGGDVNSYGGGLTVGYYLQNSPFSGWMVDSSVGLYHVDGRNSFRSSTADPLALSTTFGWSGMILDSVSVALSAGGQYALNGSRNIGDIKFNGLLPLAKFGLGYSF